MKVQDQPLMLGVPPACDHESIRYLYADLGETEPIVRVATVNLPREVNQEDILALASKLAAAPWLFDALVSCVGYVSAAAERLNDKGMDAAAKEAHRVHADAVSAIEFAKKYRHSLHDEKMRSLNKLG